MAVVTITIRNNPYQIACDNGQEKHVLQMAASLDKRLTTLASALGKGNDNLLLVMVALMMEDEITELKKSLHLANTSHTEESDKAVAQAIDNIASYVETIAKNLEKY